MDLMTASTTKLLLEKKYRNFVAPTARIKVDGIEIGEKLGAGIDHLKVDLTCDYAASGCTFDVLGQYLPSQTDFDGKGVFKLLQLGAKVEIALGYIETELVFFGLIHEVHYIFDNENPPYIHVECMDAKCLLMKIQRLEIRNEKKITQAVSALLSGQPVSSYLSGKSILLASSDQAPLQFNMENDYDFIIQQAKYTGCEFFILCGKAYFRECPKVSAPIMTMSPDIGLLSACFSLRGAPLVKKVTVVGIGPENDQQVSGSATAKGRFGKGAGANRMLAATERTYFDPRANSTKQAGDRAKVLMAGIQRQFGFLECCCIGLPELVPGRYIRMKGMMPLADTNFYITNVSHCFDSRGYTTSFEARIDHL